MQINLHNAKAEAYLRNMTFFDDKSEWEEYLKENPHLRGTLKDSPEDRFIDGKSAVDVFREATEYIPRSLIGRPLQTYIARQMIGELNQEKKNTVLDYGCGAGNVGLMFAHLGFDVDLVEVNGVITDFLRWRVKKHNLKVNVLAEEDPIRKYDLVILFNVLEHLMKPKFVLERITEALNQGGYLAILFNTHGHGLDIVSREYYEKELHPILQTKYEIVHETDETIYKKL